MYDVWRYSMIKLFVWNHLVVRFFGDWINEECEEFHQMSTEVIEHEDMGFDLD